MPFLSLGVAPMEGVTDFPMRLWLWLLGRPDFFWTPFLRVTHTYPHKDLPLGYIPELRELKDVCPYPLIPQMMAADAMQATKAAELILAHAPYVDLNCGCPAPTVVGNGAGSSLLIEPQKLSSFVRTLSKNIEGRLSVKTRLGFHSQDEWPSLAEVLADIDLVHITVHGRSREDKYRGLANWQAISFATKRWSTPVIASGDLFSLSAWQRFQYDVPRAYAAIAGRGALRFPWLFHSRRTGQTAWSVPAELLLYMLTLFHHWQALSNERTAEFIHEHAPRYFLQGHRLLADLELLRQDCETMERHVRGLNAPQLSGRMWLGRLKMLWQSLRTALPEPMASDRSLLRSATFEAFTLRFRELAIQVSDASGALPIAHNAHYDYAFASPDKT